MRLQYFPGPRVRISDRSEDEVNLTMEEAEDLYFGLGFILRDMGKVIEEAQKVRE